MDDIPIRPAAKVAAHEIPGAYPEGYVPNFSEDTFVTPSKPAPKKIKKSTKKKLLSMDSDTSDLETKLSKLDLDDIPVTNPSQPIPSHDDMPLPSRATATNSLEERPLAGGTNFSNMLEYALAEEGQPLDGAQSDDFSSMSVEDLLVSKNFKHRISAYDRIIETIRADTSSAYSFAPHIPSLLKKETNALAIDKALEVCTVYVEALNQPSSCEGLSTHAVDNLKASRASTVAKVNALLLAMVTAGAGEAVLDALLAVTNVKQQKLATEALKSLLLLLSAAGTGALPASRVAKGVRDALGHALLPVRTAAVEVLAEVYRWVGEPVVNTIAAWEVKPAMQKEIDAAIEKVKGLPPPTPTVRARGAKAVNVPGGGRSGSGSTGASGSGYLGDDAEIAAMNAGVDVCANVLGVWHEEGDPIAPAKWSERKQALTTLCEHIDKARKIAASPAMASVVAMLKQVLTREGAVAVVAEAVRAVIGLATKTGSAFRLYTGDLIRPLVPLLKEKKPHLRQPVVQALEALYYPGGADIVDVLAATTTACSDKVPQVRTHAMAWACYCLGNSQRELGLPKGKDAVVKELVNVVAGLLDDGDADVRSQSVEMLARLRCVSGESRFLALMTRLHKDNPRRATAIDARWSAMMSESESSDAATAHTNTTINRQTTSSSATYSSSSVSSSSSYAADALRTPRPPASAATATSGAVGSARGAAAGKPSAAPTNTSANAARGGGGSGGSGGGGADYAEYKEALAYSTSTPPLEDCRAALEDIIPDEVFGAEGLGSSKWVELAKAVEDITAMLSPLAGDALAKHVMYATGLFAKTPGFAHSNPAVCRAVYDSISTLLSALPPAALYERYKCVAYKIIREVASKAGDVKLTEALHKLVLALAVQVGPVFTAAQWSNAFHAAKNPKAAEGALLSIKLLVESFGALVCCHQGLTVTCHAALQHPQVSVRKVANDVLVLVYIHSGGVLKDRILRDLPAAQATALQKLLEAVPEETVQGGRSLEFPHKWALAKGSGSGNASGGGGGGNGGDDLIPRTDISPIAPAIIKQLTNKDWKERKAAMDSIAEALQRASMLIEPRDGGLFEALNLRLSDSNANLQKQALATLTMMVEAMGPPCRAYVKRCVQGVVDKLEDTRIANKQEAAACLQAWVATAGLQCCISYLGKGLRKAGSRQDILSVLRTAILRGPLPHEDATPILTDVVDGVVLALTDKTASVRTDAEAVIPFLLLSSSVGEARVRAAVLQHPPALQITLNVVLERASAAAQRLVSALQPQLPAGASAGPTSARRNGDNDGYALPAAGSALSGPASARSARPYAGAGVSMGVAQGSRGVGSASANAVDGYPPSARGHAGNGSGSGSMTARGMSSGPRRVNTARAGAGTSSNVNSSSNGGMGMGAPSRPRTAASHTPTPTQDPITVLPRTARTLRITRDSQRTRVCCFRDYEAGEIDDIRDDLRRVVCAPLAENLLSLDFKRHSEGITELQALLDTHLPETLSCVDVILRYLSWRLMDGNTNVIMCVLNYLSSLFQVLAERQLPLSDFDVAVVMPFIVDKVLGHNHAKFRQHAHHLVKLLSAVHAPVKLLGFLYEGCKHKNKRVSAECIAAIGSAIEEHGTDVIHIPKLLPLAAQLVGNSDPTVRGNALATIATFYSRCGITESELLAAMSTKTQPLSDRARQIIAERLKRTGKRVERERYSVATGNATGSGDFGQQYGYAPREGVDVGLGISMARTPARISTQNGGYNAHSGAGTGSSMYDSQQYGSYDGADAYNQHNNSYLPQPNAYTVGKGVASGYGSASTPVMNQHALQRNLQQQMNMNTGMPGLHGTTHTAGSTGNGTSVAATPMAIAMPHFRSPSSANPQQAQYQPQQQQQQQLLGNLPPTDPRVIARQQQLLTAPSTNIVRDMLPLLDAANQETIRIEAMRNVWVHFTQNPVDGHVIAVPFVNELCLALAVQVNQSFGVAAGADAQQALNSVSLSPEAEANPLRHRLCKYALNTLMELFKQPPLAMTITPQVLYPLVLSLLSRLLDPRLRAQKQDVEVKGLVRGLNILMLKVLESIDFTHAFSTLISLLTYACSLHNHRVFMDLVVRCLVKLTFRLTDRLADLRISELLQAIHNFLLRHPEASFTADADRDQVPIRALRAVVQEIAKLRGDALYDDMGGLPANSSVAVWFNDYRAQTALSMASPTAGLGAEGVHADGEGNNAANNGRANGNTGDSVPTPTQEANITTTTTTGAITTNNATSTSTTAALASGSTSSSAPMSSLSAHSTSSFATSASSAAFAAAFATPVHHGTMPRFGLASPAAPPSLLQTPRTGTSAASRLMTPRAVMVTELPNITGPTTVYNGVTVPLDMDDTQIHEYIAIVFNRLRDKSLTERAVKELYAITRVYTHIDISAHLKRSTPMFAQYVTKTLSKEKANDPNGE